MANYKVIHLCWHCASIDVNPTQKYIALHYPNIFGDERKTKEYISLILLSSLTFPTLGYLPYLMSIIIVERCLFFNS